MKKLLCILLAAVMAAALCACGGSTATHNDAGYYVIFSIDEGDDVMTQADFEDLDWTIFLQLNEDGTGVLDMDDGDIQELTWEDGVLEVEGDKAEYVIAGGMLTLDLSDEDGDFVMLFKKSTPPAEETESGGLLSRFGKIPGADTGMVGSYKAVAMLDADGEVEMDEEAIAEMEELGLVATIELREDGTGVLDIYGDITEFTWDDSSITADGESMPLSYADGRVTLTAGNESIVFEKTGAAAAPAAAIAPAEKPAEEPEAEEPKAEEPKAEEPAEKPAEEPAEEPIGAFEPVSGTVAGCEVTILGAESFVDYDGKDAIRIYYDFTNGTDMPTSAYMELYLAAEEDGYELGTTSAPDDESAPEDGHAFILLQPGVTMRCIEEFKFQPTGKALTFSVHDWEEDGISATFDPQNLPGRPDEWELELISDPQYYLNYESYGSGDYGDYAITNVELCLDWTGEEALIRYYFEFTNNSDEERSIYSGTDIRAYQDGIGLSEGYPEESVDSDSEFYVAIAPGETVTVSNCWALHSASPVEVAITDSWTGEVICAGTSYFEPQE